LPPLRERREDIVPLAEHFIGKYAGRTGAAPMLTAEAEAALLACEWPGNVRELESAIVRALPMAQGGRIEPRDLGLPGWPSGAWAATTTDPAERTGSYKAQKRRMLEAFERQYLTQLMTEQGGNVSRAARAAGKERRDLGKLLKRYGFASGQFLVRV
jgi:DNA-binding NtrC family response regulator